MLALTIVDQCAYPCAISHRAWPACRLQRRQRLFGWSVVLGAQPYVQFYRSWEIGSGWGFSGKVTVFLQPSDPISKLVKAENVGSQFLSLQR